MEPVGKICAKKKEKVELVVRGANSANNLIFTIDYANGELLVKQKSYAVLKDLLLRTMQL